MKVMLTDEGRTMEPGCWAGTTPVLCSAIVQDHCVQCVLMAISDYPAPL